MIQHLQVVGIPPTLNELKRMHWRAQHQEKKKWEQIVMIECKVQRIKPINKPVIITYRFHFNTEHRRDPDGYAYSAKSIQDGLVRSGILPDDNFNIVQELRIAKGENKKVPGITVEIMEVSA